MQKVINFPIWRRYYFSECGNCNDFRPDGVKKVHPPQEKSRTMDDEILAAPEVTIPFEPSDPSEVVVNLISSEEEDDDDVIQIVEEKSVDKAERQRRRQKKKDLWAARKLQRNKGQNVPLQTAWQRGPRPQETSSFPTPPQQSGGAQQKPLSPILISTAGSPNTSGAPTPANVSQQPTPTPSFVHTTASTSTHPEISLNINSDLALLIRLGPDGRPILTRVENVEQNNTSTSTPTTTRKLPPAPPPPKISFDTQTGESLLNGELITRPIIDITTDSPPSITHAATVSPQTSRTSGPPTLSPISPPPRTTQSNPAHPPPRYEPRKSRHPPRDPLASSSSSSSSSPSPPPTSRARHTSSANIPPPLEPLFLNTTQLIHLIKTCRKCEKSFPTRCDGVIHQKKEHNRKHCPVCFLTLSRHGNTYKDHLNMYHALEGDKEMVVCPFCAVEHSFDGLYNHIGRSHLIPVESKGESEHEVIFSVAPSPQSNGHQTRSVTQGNTPPKNDTNSPPNLEKRRPGPASKTRKTTNDPVPSTSRTGLICHKYVPDVETPPSKAGRNFESRAGRNFESRNVYPPATNRLNPPRNKSPPRNKNLPRNKSPPRNKSLPRNKTPPPSSSRSSSSRSVSNNLRRKNPTPPPPTQPPPKKVAKPDEAGINEKIQAAIKAVNARVHIERSVHHPNNRSDREIPSTSRTVTSRHKVPTSKTSGNTSVRKDPSPPPPLQTPPKTTNLELSKVQKARIVEDVRSIVRDVRITRVLDDGEVPSTSRAVEEENPTPRSKDLKAIHISKLNLIYQQLKCYPDTSVIANVAKECGVEIPVVAKWFTKKHMEYCQKTQQRKRKRKPPELR
ncbi:serine/arginine repetitive matrix protein 1 [Folsomia candida]|uniref:serine/arginine repetitive matrix protein 1 n=1 Tax=Folsomia candida TaxID=158441 RepID=UPI000B903323|nr:serine/arginine repetitive matrix protein 1 [Folsomia candida]XP_035716735.1 serine/arginine repetitive matrix protein 1 [Folsomia candida]XP_035716736.1 serine/arginine repetitive matrix protein 1 [Folsomia candida]